MDTTSFFTYPRVCGGDPNSPTQVIILSLLIPAYAGVIPSFPAFLASKATYPRVCGGDPIIMYYLTMNGDLSPRMRG